MKRNRGKRPVHRKVDFEEELDLDKAQKGRLIALAVAGGLLVIGLAAAFFLFLESGKSRREAVEAQIEIRSEKQPEAAEEETQGESGLSQEQDRQEGTAPGESTSDIEDTKEGGQNPVPGKSDAGQEQGQVSVGALDDAQDPQEDGAAGNEGSGAEVTVAPIGKDETAQVTMGIDVSKYQGTIDWAKVKESGVEFAMIRVGYRAKSTGEIFEDPTARYNMQEAQAAGIKLGAYFFSSAVTLEEARAEAAFTSGIIAKYKITYPVAYNCEDFLSSDSRQYGLDRQTRTALAWMKSHRRAIRPCFMRPRESWRAARSGIPRLWRQNIKYGWPNIRPWPIRKRRLRIIRALMPCGSIPARERWQGFLKRPM